MNRCLDRGDTLCVLLWYVFAIGDHDDGIGIFTPCSLVLVNWYLYSLFFSLSQLVSLLPVL